MGKLTALYLAANPMGTTQLNLDQEIRMMTEKIRSSEARDAIELISAWAVRPDDLLQCLNIYKPAIVHFSGHGSKHGEIILAEQDGNPKLVDAETICELFRTLKDNVRVIIFNTCNSRIQAETIVKVIDCAIGMNNELEDQAAIVFPASFYRAIGFGRSIQEAFDQGLVSLRLQNMSNKNMPVLKVKDGVDPSQIWLTKLVNNCALDVKNQETSIVELRIERDFDLYTTEDQDKLLRAIRELLRIDQDLKITKVRKGSVLISIEVPREKLDELLLLVQSGKLHEFGVSYAELVDIEGQQLSTSSLKTSVSITQRWSLEQPKNISLLTKEILSHSTVDQADKDNEKSIKYKNPKEEQQSKKINYEGRFAGSLDWETKFMPFAHKMRQAGVHETAIRTFRYYYMQLLHGATSYVSATTAQPVDNLPVMDELAHYQAAGLAALDQTVVIKLNGGLGTTMGMQGPKSLIEVKGGFSFLDIIVRQILHMREEHKARLPLVLMNSFNTQTKTRAALKAYPHLQQDVPLDFLQHKTPKIWQDNLEPVHWPSDPEKEWCLPGHGDIYLALQTSGILQHLLDKGYEYAFVSNADNLGATIDPTILGYFAQEKLPFLMEVAKRRAADAKGGHLAVSPEGSLMLREVAQCPPDEMYEFQDIERYCYFNTNNLWIHLPTLQQTLKQQQGVLGLPLIRNEKPVDLMQPDTRRVYQLETAMGHAIALFHYAQAVQVQRTRFLPVKNTNDLLALWSDAYVLNDDYTIQPNPARESDQELVIDLDKEYYGLFQQLKAHFPRTVPSLVNCNQLRIKGNIYFDAYVILEGDVSLRHSGERPLTVGWHGSSEQVDDTIHFKKG